MALREAKARAEDETAEARLEAEQFASRAADQRELAGVGCTRRQGFGLL